MSEASPTPEKIWIITGETHLKTMSPEQNTGTTRGGSRDMGGILGSESSDVIETVDSGSNWER